MSAAIATVTARAAGSGVDLRGVGGQGGRHAEGEDRPAATATGTAKRRCAVHTRSAASTPASTASVALAPAHPRRHRHGQQDRQQRVVRADLAAVAADLGLDRQRDLVKSR